MRIIAFCYLQQQGDERNKCLLYESEFHIIKDGRIHKYSLDVNVSFLFSRRKWMLPLIAGAIFFSLSMLFIFRNLADPWLSLSLLITSMFLIYLGWEGSPVLEIRSGNISHIVPTRGLSLNLIEFVRFVESYQRNYLYGENTLLIYHLTDQEQWNNQKRKNFYRDQSLDSEGFIHCSNKEQLIRTYKNNFNDREMVILSIDPLRLGAELRFEKDVDSGQLSPHLYGPLEKSAIVGSDKFRGLKELQKLLHNL